MRRSFSHAVGMVWIVALLIASGTVSAQSIGFRKVADTSTPIPMGTGTFQLLGIPTISNGNVAFHNLTVSTTPVQSGIFIEVGGVLNVVANTATTIPGTTEKFKSLNPPLSLDGTDIAFVGVGATDLGVYLSIGGSLSRVVDTNTIAPGSTDDFDAFFSLSLDGGLVAFCADLTGSVTPEGCYTNAGGTLRAVADLSTTIPGGSVSFSGFSPGVAFDGGTVFLAGRAGGTQAGLFSDTSGTLSIVADKSTAIPDGTGTFLGFQIPSADAGNVAFLGGNVAERGVYSSIGGSLIKVADLNTPIPGGTGTFTVLLGVSQSGNNVAFLGQGSGQAGIYAWFNNNLIKIVDRSAPFDGKTIILLAPMGSDGMSGDEVVFLAIFQDGSRGIFVAEIGGVSSPLCGDAFAEGDEMCDDGNTTDGDGCSSTCELEPMAASVPTASGWGLIAMFLLLAAAAKVYFGYERPMPTEEER